MSEVDAHLVFDLADLVGLFGEPLPLSNPDVEDYWFRYERADGVAITLSLAGYERTVALIVRDGPVACSTVRLRGCDAVRVLEADRRTFEVTVSGPGAARCFVALDGDSVLDLEVPGS